MPRQSKAVTEILGEIDMSAFDDVSEICRRNSQVPLCFPKQRTKEFDATESCDFELEEDGIDQVRGNLSEEIRQSFETAKANLFQLLDQALFDVACDGFFDRDCRAEVNAYFDEFLQTLGRVLVALKNSFNKA